MTIDEAIVHAREVAEKKRRGAGFQPADSVDNDIKASCLRCAEEHEQLAEWLEELKRWRTSVINPKIKNVFANSSTQICQNCDHKDEYIEDLEAEVAEYRDLEKHLSDMFASNISLRSVVDELERTLKEPDSPHPMNARILTYKESADWDAYCAVDTPEECRAAMEKQNAKKPTAVLGTFGGTEYECKNCGSNVQFEDDYCRWCGQKLDWSEEES